MFIFHSLVLKIASRCNLNCSYCFMYNLGDDSYKKQPKFMIDDTIENVIEKAKAYIIKNQLKTFNFLFHGGEPLLIEKNKFRKILLKIKALEDEVKNLQISFSIQTNGVLLDEEWCQLLYENQVEIGISIDSTQASHDKYRVDHKGKGSYEAVKKAIELVKKTTKRADVITVMDVEESPVMVYESLKKLNIDTVNFLIKDFTHTNFPYIKDEKYNHPYANFLIELFDIWFEDKEKLDIPIFVGYINVILGFANFDDVNSNELKSLIIETNGGIEPIDSLKVCGQEFTKTNKNIKEDDLDAIFESSLGSLYFNESMQVCSQCKDCPIFEICLGGRLVHRFDKKNGFDNPSVYCEDMVKFICHIQNRLLDVFPDIDKTEIERLNYKEIIAYNSLNAKRKLDNENLKVYKEAI